jgi:hypothetical protein
MARIVPNNSAFRKRNRFGNVTSALRLFEIARVLVRFNHVARLIVNANHCVMRPAVKRSNHRGKRASLPSDGTFRGLKSRASLCPSAICSRVILFSSIVIL